jgi:hypothetical protein
VKASAGINTGALWPSARDREDIAVWLVRNGLAFDWPRYSKGKYAGAQKEAERAGGYGRGVILCRGAIGLALGTAVGPGIVRTMRTNILDGSNYSRNEGNASS